MAWSKWSGLSRGGAGSNSGPPPSAGGRAVRLARPRRSRNFWLFAAACGLALGALSLAPALFLTNAVVGEAKASAPPAPQPAEQRERGFTLDPAFKVEARDIGPSQQFEIRLRLVLPGNPQGYSIGVRHTVKPEDAVNGRFVRLSARLPGLVRSPRPYVELSVISRNR